VKGAGIRTKREASLFLTAGTLLFIFLGASACSSTGVQKTLVVYFSDSSVALSEKPISGGVVLTSFSIEQAEGTIDYDYFYENLIQTIGSKYGFDITVPPEQGEALSAEKSLGIQIIIREERYMGNLTELSSISAILIIEDLNTGAGILKIAHSEEGQRTVTSFLTVHRLLERLLGIAAREMKKLKRRDLNDPA